ncbi:MAG: DUF1735 domain-containing protein [Flavisolibacter sp.]
MSKVLNIKLYLFMLVSFAFASCLKDKGYENGEYGSINSNVEGQEWVSIPLAGKATNALALESKSGNQDVNLLKVAYDYKDPAAQDIVVTLAIDNSLVTDPNLEKVPDGVASLPSTTVTIPAGQRVSDWLKMTINTGTLDPLKQYGIGIKITSVNKSGVQIPSNLGKIVFSISLKNKYDGVYKLTGYHNRTPYDFPYETTMHMVTVGPNSVQFWWPEVSGPGHPIGVGPDPVNDISWYGAAISPIVVFDPATNKVVDVYNESTAVPITLFTGPGSRESKFDPATKHITVDWNYSNNALRAFFDDLEYIKARP